MRRYKWFKLSEFDSPDKEGSGEMMDDAFMQTLDLARDIAGFPMIVTSGFRTVEHNRMLINKGYAASKNSSHLLGYAADIHCNSSRKRYLLLEALMDAGFTRIGIGSSFIHVDNDSEKSDLLIWTY
jgi:uncharacterized protein YcbK (DUF882 family)